MDPQTRVEVLAEREAGASSSLGSRNESAPQISLAEHLMSSSSFLMLSPGLCFDQVILI